jgi:hypothetical protein
MDITREEYLQAKGIVAVYEDNLRKQKIHQRQIKLSELSKRITDLTENKSVEFGDLETKIKGEDLIIILEKKQGSRGKADDDLTNAV